ncbi:MAG TPA: FRG domain-containing protein, partial [Candidatus Saccharimonadales bacterium]|nr:FRG domain-containing protein [Candidatus Saccharimonadales bacterium]
MPFSNTDLEAFLKRHGVRPYVQQFCHHGHLVPRQMKLEVKIGTLGRPYIEINDPAVLMRFTGYVKRHYHSHFGGHVFMRGQPADYGTMIPSLFRGVFDDRLEGLVEAYRAFITRIQTEFRNERFQTNQLGALLQHYGFKTPWLDLVDNLYVALWFAGRRAVDEGGKVRLVSTNEDGWLFLVGTGGKTMPRLTYSDLRVTHSSLTLRPHAQHGISATRPARTKWSPSNKCFNESVVAVVKVPAEFTQGFTGPLSDQEFLFPDPAADDTYRILLRSRTQKIVESVCSEFGLTAGEL